MVRRPVCSWVSPVLHLFFFLCFSPLFNFILTYDWRGWATAKREPTVPSGCPWRLRKASLGGDSQDSVTLAMASSGNLVAELKVQALCVTHRTPPRVWVWRGAGTRVGDAFSKERCTPASSEQGPFLAFRVGNSLVTHF